MDKRDVDSFSDLTAGMASLTPSQRSMLLVLADLGEPATINLLTEKTGLHANSVRETLGVLMDSGLVQRGQVPSSSRGRPAWEYETSVPADLSAIMGEFAGFANAVCAYLGATSDDPQGEALAIGKYWGDRLLGDSSVGSPLIDDEYPTAHPLAKLRILFSTLGFGAVAGEDDRSIELTVCPFAKDGKAPDRLLCQMHAGMVSALLTSLTNNEVDADINPRFPEQTCVVSLQPNERAV